jgi:hypothetical protein
MGVDDVRWSLETALTGTASALLALTLLTRSVGSAWAKVQSARAQLDMARAAAQKELAIADDIRTATRLKVMHFELLRSALVVDPTSPLVHEFMSRLTSGTPPPGIGPGADAAPVPGLAVVPSVASAAINHRTDAGHSGATGT